MIVRYIKECAEWGDGGMRLVGPITGLFVSAGVSAVTSAVMDVWRHSHVKTNVGLADASKKVAFADLCRNRQLIIRFRNTLKDKWPRYQGQGEDIDIGLLVEVYLQRLSDMREYTFHYDGEGEAFPALVYQKELAIKNVFRAYVKYYDIHWDRIPPHIGHQALTDVLHHQLDRITTPLDKTEAGKSLITSLEECILNEYDMSKVVLNDRHRRQWNFNGRTYWHSEAYNLICWIGDDGNMWAVDQRQRVRKPGPDYGTISPGTGFPDEAHMGMFYDGRWQSYVRGNTNQTITWTVKNGDTCSLSAPGSMNKPWEPNYKLQMQDFEDKKRPSNINFAKDISQAIGGAHAVDANPDAGGVWKKMPSAVSWNGLSAAQLAKQAEFFAATTGKVDASAAALHEGVIQPVSIHPRNEGATSNSPVAHGTSKKKK
jgi:hypothetical protein